MKGQSPVPATAEPSAEPVNQPAEPSAPEVSPSVQDPLFVAAVAHPALALSAVVLLIGVAELSTTARGDPDTIRALLAYADMATIALAMVVVALPLLPLAWFASTGMELVLRTVNPAEVASTPTPLPPIQQRLFILVASLALAVVTSPAWAFQYAVYGALALVLVQVLVLLALREKAEQVRIAFWTLIVAGIVTAIVLVDRPWLPSETVQPKAGAPIVGYVLGASGDSLILLRHDNRELATIKQADIEKRTPCSMAGEADSRTPLQIVLGVASTRLPPCN
jgi:hypothetical protein